MLKKLALTILSLLLLLNSMVLPLTALASDNTSTWYNQGIIEWYAKVYGDESPPSEIFGERYTAAQVQWILYSLFSFPINIFGSSMQSVASCIMATASLGTNLKEDAVCVTKTVEFITKITTDLNIGNIIQSNNAAPSDLGLINSIYRDYQNRPISGIKYTINTVSKFVSVPTASAQGFGFGAVDGLQKYWQGFRDMAYALTVLVIIIFSFMIMFRVKLSPQLVISVQSALPKVFVALILATFSYAIAGFVIDLSYVVGGLFASLMNLAGFATSFGNAFNQIVPIGYTGTIDLGSFYILGWMFLYAMLFFVAAIISIVSSLFGGLSGYGTILSFLMMIMTMWVLVLMVWYTLTIPFKLLKNLVSLFISIVVAPVQIIMGALVPSIGFGVWFKKIIAETFVFPLVGLFLFLAGSTLKASLSASLGQLGIVTIQNPDLWSPPILGSSTRMASVLWLAVSFTFITMIPKAVDIMKMLVMGAKFDFGSAMGEAVAPLKWGWGMSGAPYIESVRRERTEKSIEEGTNWLNNRIDRIFGKISGKKTNG